jgi:type VI protein secretion system component VasK
MAASPVDGGAGNYFQTISPDQLVRPAAPAAGGKPAQTPISGARPAAAGQRVTKRLSSQASSHQLQRLENICGMLRRHRHPVCPANGILTLLPFEMLKAGDQDVAELERAINADLTTIYRELQLRCPVTAVVVGMEQERGFRELIRRIPREHLKQRFGQKFDIRVPATEDELRNFSSHVCGTFEDWVYMLFRDDQALSHPGNTYLYALLCKVRRTMKARLGNVLGKGFGSTRKDSELSMLFSGCYFAATGPKSDRQAFVSGLLSKLYDEQEDIEWTADALRDDSRRGLLATIGWTVAALLLVAAGIWFALNQFMG